MNDMMILQVNTKQFADAHEWALKASRPIPPTTAPTTPRASWRGSMTYPDFAVARGRWHAAGDPGNIPEVVVAAEASAHNIRRRSKKASTCCRSLCKSIRAIRCHGLHEPAVSNQGGHGRYAGASCRRHRQSE